MKKTAYIFLIYSILVLIGGYIGHLKGSQASLIAGSISGALLLANAFWMFKGKINSLYTALMLTFVLDAFFTYRFVKTHAFMPGGMMSLISFGVMFILVTQVSRSLKKTRTE